MLFFWHPGVFAAAWDHQGGSMMQLCCLIGQQAEDGGETVQLLLDVLRQLLVLLIPVQKTDRLWHL